MKLAFISDIHGNLEALEAVLEDIKRREVDRIYCLGDLVGYGPDPVKVVQKIKVLGIPAVMGNYDDAYCTRKEKLRLCLQPWSRNGSRQHHLKLVDRQHFPGIEGVS